MFEAMINGGSLQRIAEDLRARGVLTPTKRGKWHAQTIRDILLRNHYCGRAYAWGWRKRTKGNPQQFDPEKAIALPSGTIPAIVSEEMWEAVQERMQLNRARAIRSAKNPESALLRGGYVSCGRCGRTMLARLRCNGKIEYICGHGKRNGDCGGNSIIGPSLDAATWARVEAILRNPAIVEQEVNRLRKADPAADDLAAVNRVLADIERQSANIARAMAQIDDDEAAAPLIAQLSELKQRRQSMRAEMARIETRHAEWQDTQLALDSLIEWTSVIGRNLDAMTWTERRLAMDALGVKVTVYPHGHEPRFVITADIPLELASSTT
jgi:site-specific DNA recombinase